MESDLQKQNIILPSSTKINTQIFAFEQVMIACPEENLQTEIFILHFSSSQSPATTVSKH